MAWDWRSRLFLSFFTVPLAESVIAHLIDNTVRNCERVSMSHFTTQLTGDYLYIRHEEDCAGKRSEITERFSERRSGKNMGPGPFLSRKNPAIPGISLTVTREPEKWTPFEMKVLKRHAAFWE